MNILFLCTANINRSKTAEKLFSIINPANEYRSAGLSEKECLRHGTTLCNEMLLKWANVVFVMEDEHLRRIQEHTGQEFLDKIIVLGIPDIYKFGEPALIEQLKNALDVHHIASPSYVNAI
ncbi:hypothetical protein L9G16_01035 [Shewanella sp. A25]|nr:hypothetical protein [Shewanella shenzhenensis]